MRTDAQSPTSPHVYTHPTAFTLKEVLVVVTAITVLIAILLPSITSARRTAQRAACLSNIRQLGYSFTANASDNAGKTLPTYASGGKFWATEFMSYSSKTDTSKNILLSALCPSATNSSGKQGTASLAWGPSSTYQAPGSTLVVNNQYGSYGLNGWLYRNNLEAIGVMCNSVTNLGNIAINGNLISKGAVSMSGSSSVSAAVIAGGNISVGGSASVGSTKPNTPGLSLPDIDAIFNTLAATPGKQTVSSLSGNVTLNFNTYPVIHCTGNANLNNATIVGSGTLIVAGNFTGFPGTSGVSMNIVALGSVSFNGGSRPNNFNGSVYCKGNFSNSTSNWNIVGNVITAAALDSNGGTITAAPPPSWDNTPRAGYLNSLNSVIVNAAQIPVFGDCIWAEAWPATGEVIPTNFNTNNGDITNHLGRFYINRHNKAINVAFLDGHAETVPLNNLKSLKWSNQF